MKFDRTATEADTKHNRVTSLILISSSIFETQRPTLTLLLFSGRSQKVI